ncbi:MAG TPA: GNAT family N-acetyltransferase [Pseudonocardia sp.]|jgi:ribosomal protein S18 acetylase RimI-like enzyme|nr:GNAT family N-acetyltransferase [Pseudonocardia sp.]
MTVLADLRCGDTTIRLRRAGVEDVPAIVALLADDVLGSTRDGAGTDEELAPYLRAFRIVDADPAQLLVVACTGADTQPQVVGTMQLGFLPGLARRGAVRAQIEAVRIRSDQRGRRLGEAMITWAVEEARRRRCAIVQLTSDKSRTDAHRFYERLGFVASHEGLKLAL